MVSSPSISEDGFVLVSRENSPSIDVLVCSRDGGQWATQLNLLDQVDGTATASLQHESDSPADAEADRGIKVCVDTDMHSFTTIASSSSDMTLLPSCESTNFEIDTVVGTSTEDAATLSTSTSKTLKSHGLSRTWDYSFAVQGRSCVDHCTNHTPPRQTKGHTSAVTMDPTATSRPPEYYSHLTLLQRQNQVRLEIARSSGLLPPSPVKVYTSMSADSSV